MFQFQMVRLKYMYAFSVRNSAVVSIPNGSIKINLTYNDIARNLVSIPNGSIKILRCCRVAAKVQEFQFQMVRLKLENPRLDRNMIRSFNSKWFD